MQRYQYRLIKLILLITITMADADIISFQAQFDDGDGKIRYTIYANEVE